jgi:hypothetical protein
MRYADPQVLNQVLDFPNVHEIEFAPIDLEIDLAPAIETGFIKTTIMPVLSETQVSSCRHCHYYAHEGRRGGYCESLNVVVQGSWQACPLAISTFKGSDPIA